MVGKSEPQIQALRAGRFPSQKTAGKLQWKKMLQAVMAVPTEGGRFVELGVGISWAAARVCWNLGAGYVVGPPLAIQLSGRKAQGGPGKHQN